MGKGKRKGTRTRRGLLPVVLLLAILAGAGCSPVRHGPETDPAEMFAAIEAATLREPAEITLADGSRPVGGQVRMNARWTSWVTFPDTCRREVPTSEVLRIAVGRWGSPHSEGALTGLALGTLTGLTYYFATHQDELLPAMFGLEDDDETRNDNDGLLVLGMGLGGGLLGSLYDKIHNRLTIWEINAEAGRPVDLPYSEVRPTIP